MIPLPQKCCCSGVALQMKAAARGLRAAAPVSHMSTRAYPSAGALHKSKIPTYHFQASIPPLPVPELNDTLDKYALRARL
ncbi:hypothetical protein EON67_11570 [archaeon]|nr:MAG: hypothetical protein EON67_11570 [archaeon]